MTRKEIRQLLNNLASSAPVVKSMAEKEVRSRSTEFAGGTLRLLSEERNVKSLLWISVFLYTFLTAIVFLVASLLDALPTWSQPMKILRMIGTPFPLLSLIFSVWLVPRLHKVTFLSPHQRKIAMDSLFVAVQPITFSALLKILFHSMQQPFQLEIEYDPIINQLILLLKQMTVSEYLELKFADKELFMKLLQCNVSQTQVDLILEPLRIMCEVDDRTCLKPVQYLIRSRRGKLGHWKLIVNVAREVETKLKNCDVRQNPSAVLLRGSESQLPNENLLRSALNNKTNPETLLHTTNNEDRQ